MTTRTGGHWFGWRAEGELRFLADLCRAIDLPVEIDFLGLSSYGDGQESSGVVQVTQDLSRPVESKHILVVEDIVDTGLTMEYLLENLSTRKPASVRIASLLHKPARSQVDIDIDYLGFEIPIALSSATDSITRISFEIYPSLV